MFLQHEKMQCRDKSKTVYENTRKSTMGEKIVTTPNWICSCLCTLDENTILLFVKDETLALYYFETNPCFFKGEEFNYAKQDFESSKTINENIGERNVGEKLAGTLYWISCFF